MKTRKYIKSCFALLFTIFVVAKSAYGQGQAVFVASTNARQVLLDNYFEIFFNLKNANGSQFAPPNFKDFVVVAGPSTSSSIQYLNGVASREMSYSYTLQPTKLGKFTIGSATIRANGKVLESQPISIEVVKGSTKPTGKNRDFFINVEPSKRQAYVGEQILFDIKLYTKVGIEGYDMPEDPNYEGFYAVELRRFHSNAIQEVLNGQAYTTKILRRIALFPQKAGELTVNPFRIQLAVVEENERSFFFGRNVKPVYFTTEAVSINVKPIPDDAPIGYCGAVGEYEIEAGIDKNSATTDDAIALTLKLKGNGDVKRIHPPTLVVSDSFEVYTAKLKEDKSEEIQGKIINERTYEYLMLPKFHGSYSIQPKVCYFNTSNNKFDFFEVPSFKLQVKNGTGKSNKGAKENSNEMKEILPPISNGKLQKSSNFGLILVICLFFLPVFFIAGAVVRQKRQKGMSNKVPTLERTEMAKQLAQKRLELAHSFIAKNDSKVFYSELSKSLLNYLADKTNAPMAQVTKEYIKAKLFGLNVNQSTIEELLTILQQCEIAVYAGMGNNSTMQSFYDKALEILTVLNKEIDQFTKSSSK